MKDDRTLADMGGVQMIARSIHSLIVVIECKAYPFAKIIGELGIEAQAAAAS